MATIQLVQIRLNGEIMKPVSAELVNAAGPAFHAERAASIPTGGADSGGGRWAIDDASGSHCAAGDGDAHSPRFGRDLLVSVTIFAYREGGNPEIAMVAGTVVAGTSAHRI